MIQFVYCISSLGMPYTGILVEDNFSLDTFDDVKAYFKRMGYDNPKCALVYDPEYAAFDVVMWGFDCFTFEQAKAKGHTHRTEEEHIESIKEKFDQAA